MATRISIRRAILVGMLWINGSALAGFALPLAAFTVLGESGFLNRLSGEGVLGLLISLFVASLVIAWAGWSTQTPRWRLWAYRRVDDIAALKSAAVSASLTWPDGHLLERTEFRTRDQAEELFRLEKASLHRQASGLAGPEPVRTPTRLRTGAKALFFGLAFMPLCILAPAGVLSWVGIDLSNSPVYWAAVAAFPVVVAGLIYRKAHRDGVSADEAFRRILPRGIRSENPAD